MNEGKGSCEPRGYLKSGRQSARMACRMKGRDRRLLLLLFLLFHKFDEVCEHALAPQRRVHARTYSELGNLSFIADVWFRDKSPFPLWACGCCGWQEELRLLRGSQERDRSGSPRSQATGKLRTSCRGRRNLPSSYPRPRSLRIASCEWSRWWHPQYPSRTSGRDR